MRTVRVAAPRRRCAEPRARYRAVGCAGRRARRARYARRIARDPCSKRAPAAPCRCRRGRASASARRPARQPTTHRCRACMAPCQTKGAARQRQGAGGRVTLQRGRRWVRVTEATHAHAQAAALLGRSAAPACHPGLLRDVARHAKSRLRAPVGARLRCAQVEPFIFSPYVNPVGRCSRSRARTRRWSSLTRASRDASATGRPAKGQRDGVPKL